ncbi:RNA polymerase recycling motor HelD [Anaerophilus nitritogenes]|uniref:RNA polymerase recycling motor HelD n=1 Tax=Anaerophilus nitritogenes TaxID=2498136 RepID=UPI00101E05F7|nr:RNA polymerase recycling motor HelD [Anaerophilus nitritogenes]
MSVKNHPAYTEEKERLDYTIDYIKRTIDATEEYKTLYKENIHDAMVNLDYLDSSQSYISILVNTKFMEIAEKNYDHLIRATKKPYFARIDFKQKNSEKLDKVYIGKMSLSTAEDNIPLIVDWRSPIANVYYEGRLGEVSYQTETDIQEGEMLLKRQFSIENGNLENILDIDITTTDTFLQASLDAHAEKKLKDIASTIQGEQNRVIRADMDKPLVVQGVAGSGKTTIALHRIAYFIYTYEETFDPDNFMIIAPNKLFINYISEVLPELGVEQVKQTTFIDFMKEIIGIKHKLINTDEKLITLIHTKNDDKSSTKNELIQWAASFKGSLTFKDLIDAYVEDLEEDFTPKENFQLENHIFFTAKKIKALFKGYKHLPLYKRMAEVKKSLSNKLKYEKPHLLEEIENNYNQQIEYMRENVEPSEERRLKIVALIDERDEKLQCMKNDIKNLVKKYMNKFPKKDLLYYYQEIITKEKSFEKYLNHKIEKEKIQYLCNYSKELLGHKKIEVEDLAPLAYLKHRIFGFEKNITINNVVIDEAQDFSLFQFYALRKILNTEMFTLLGDLSQGIHSYRAIDNWNEVLEQIFTKGKSNYMTLEQSYRTTIEIMNLANEIIKQYENPNIVLAQPVIRHGNKPQVKSFDSSPKLIEQLEKQVQSLQKEDFKSIALLCKTMDECLKVKKYLDKNKKIQAHLLNGEEESYEAGVVIVPSYLAKGLEFDVVFILNLEEKYLDQELDIKLLYVAMTRPMHRLYIFHVKNTMPLLEKMDEKLYDIK